MGWHSTFAENPCEAGTCSDRLDLYPKPDQAASLKFCPSAFISRSQAKTQFEVTPAGDQQTFSTPAHRLPAQLCRAARGTGLGIADYPVDHEH